MCVSSGRTLGADARCMHAPPASPPGLLHAEGALQLLDLISLGLQVCKQQGAGSRREQARNHGSLTSVPDDARWPSCRA